MLYVYTVTSLIVNTTFFVLIMTVEFEDRHPTDGTRAELRHTVSNIAFILPLIPYILMKRDSESSKMATFAQDRRKRIIVYALALGVLSCIHHAFAYRTSSVYIDNDSLLILWRSIDWALSRLTTPLVLFSILSPNAVTRLTSRTGLLTGMEIGSGIGLYAILLRDVSCISSEPFSSESVTVTISASCGLLLCLILIPITVNPGVVIPSLARHFGGSRLAALNTLNFIVSLATSLVTRIEGDDPTGLVHLIWHCATASTLAAAVTLVFDETQHMPEDTTEPALHIL